MKFHPSNITDIATAGPPFALRVHTGKPLLVETITEAWDLLGYARSLYAFGQERTTGFYLHDAEERSSMSVGDREKLDKEHARVMRAIYAWQERTGEKITGGVIGTERLRRAEERKCAACFFDVRAYANEVRA